MITTAAPIAICASSGIINHQNMDWACVPDYMAMLIWILLSEAEPPFLDVIQY